MAPRKPIRLVLATLIIALLFVNGRRLVMQTKHQVHMSQKVDLLTMSLKRDNLREGRNEVAIDNGARNLKPKSTNESKATVQTSKIGVQSTKVPNQENEEHKIRNEPAKKQSLVPELEDKLMEIIAEERVAGLQRACHLHHKYYGLNIDTILKLPPRQRPRFYFSDKYKLLLCEIPKCGSTNWKRAILTMEGINVAKNSFGEIRGDHAHEHAALLDLWKNYDENDPESVAKAKYRITNYTRIMTVREPLERLVSAYKDKMLPSGTGGSSFGAMSQRIHKVYETKASNKSASTSKVSHASWKEFVHYLLDDHRKIYIDAHWQMFSKMCYPCIVTYNHMAKLETIFYDVKYLSGLLGYDLMQYFPASKAKNRHEKWSTEYQDYFGKLTKRERDQLYQMYIEQYDLFGYSKPSFL